MKKRRRAATAATVGTAATAAATAPEASRDGSLFPAAPPAAYRRPLPLSDLMVLTSDEELVRWNRGRIVEVLVREADVEPVVADEIGARIEEQLQKARLQAVSTAVLRELVGAELILLGRTVARARHARLGVSLFDVGGLLRGTGAVPALTPATSADALARRIKRDYALAVVLSERASDAHVRGSLHVHDLDQVDRPLSIVLPLAATCALAIAPGDGGGAAGARAGAGAGGEAGGGRGGDGGRAARARPSLNGVELALRIVSRVGELRGLVAGSLGLDALNLALAPHAASDTEASETARVLVQGLGALGAHRLEGSPPLVRATLELPSPDQGGIPGSDSGDDPALAGRSARALIEATAAHVRPGGALLELVLVLDPAFFRSPGHLKLLEAAAQAARTGAPVVFRFRRDEAPAEEDIAPAPATRGTARSRRPVTRGTRAGATPAVLAAVSIDLPRLAYLAGPDEEGIEARLLAALDVAAGAHIDRRVFLEDLLARGAAGPLGGLVASGAGGALLRVDHAVHAIVPCGLNELAELVTGAPLHASEEAIAFGVRLLERLRRHVETLGRKHRMRFVLMGLPAALPAARFAKLDLRHHSPSAGHHVKGDLRLGRVHYTAGIGLDPDVAVPVAQRLALEGRLHRALGGEAETVIPEKAVRGSRRIASELVMEAYLRSSIAGLRFGGERQEAGASVA